MDPGPRFEEHIITAHPFECEHCDLRYVEEDKLRKHKRSHQKGKVKERRVADGGKMGEHQVESLSQMNNANKPKGPKKAAVAPQLPKSREEARSKSVDSVTVVTNYWKCNSCETPFLSALDMRNHQGKPHGKSCNACSMKFIHATDMKRHQVERHNAVSKGMPKCELCGEATENKSLASHKKAKHTFKCRLCNLAFAQTTKLWRHMIEEHQQGTWVNRPVAEAPSNKMARTQDLTRREHPTFIPKLVDGGREMEAVKRKEEKIVPRKISKPKEEKWETVKVKKERADESREKLRKETSGGKASTSGAKETNTGTKAVNIGVKATNTVVKATNTVAKSTNSGVKATNTVAKATNVKSGVTATNSEGRIGGKKHLNEAGGGESEKLEECRKCKEVCSLFFAFVFVPFGLGLLFVTDNLSNPGAAVEKDGWTQVERAHASMRSRLQAQVRLSCRPCPPLPRRPPQSRSGQGRRLLLLQLVL